jgi:hypothetical protein
LWTHIVSKREIQILSIPESGVIARVIIGVPAQDVSRHIGKCSWSALLVRVLPVEVLPNIHVDCAQISLLNEINKTLVLCIRVIV